MKDIRACSTIFEVYDLFPQLIISEAYLFTQEANRLILRCLKSGTPSRPYSFLRQTVDQLTRW